MGSSFQSEFQIIICCNLIARIDISSSKTRAPETVFDKIASYE